MRTRITKKKLNELAETCEKLVQHWQSILGLRDWSVKIVITREPYENAASWTEFDVRHRVATIYIYADAYLKQSDAFFDLDYAIVHELLHWWFAQVLDEESETVRELHLEQAINAIARGLVELNRRAAE